MTQEEKAKAYDEALERAKEMIKAMTNIGGVAKVDDIQHIFQLNESEDERIRKEIITFIVTTPKERNNHKKWISWLEKQGKEEYALKSFKNEDVRKFMQYIEKQAKAYEFNLPNRSYDVYAFTKDILYWLEKQGEKGTNGNEREIPNSEQKPVDKVEPKFKVGDIISDGISEVKIVSIDKNNYNVTNDEIENDAHTGNWVVYFKDQDNWKLVEQKPAEWSEEDENIMSTIMKEGDLKPSERNWLKSLKNRVGCEANCTTTNEWSKEDYNEIETIACHLDNTDNEGMAEVLRNIRDKYYHVIPQTTWKPSDEQIKVCKEVYADLLSAKGFDVGTINSELNRLEEQLKKLKE